MFNFIRKIKDKYNKRKEAVKLIENNPIYVSKIGVRLDKNGELKNYYWLKRIN